MSSSSGIPSCVTRGPTEEGDFDDPGYPDYSTGSPGGVVVNDTIKITYSGYFEAQFMSTAWTAMLVPVVGHTLNDGIRLFENRVFDGDESSNGPCRVMHIRTSVRIPEDAYSKIRPRSDAVRIVIYNTTGEVSDPAEAYFRHSPAFYLRTNRNIQSTVWAPIPGLTSTGEGAVKPPSGRQIATHGAIGICIGLGIIFIALLCETLFLRFFRRKDNESERSTWQERLNLAEASIGDEGEEQIKAQIASYMKGINVRTISLTASSTI